MNGPLALKLFQIDYITSFKFKKLNIFFVPISNIILNGWCRKRLATRVVAMKVTAPKLHRQKVLFPINNAVIILALGL